MRYFLILWFCSALPLVAIAQVCGLEDTLWINPNASHIYTIEIDGLVNDDFSNPDQGVCGLEIEFVHQFVENLEVWVTSPGGTTVQLMGPNSDDPSAFTFFARWDIEFVPCDSAAAPDLGYAAQWNNNQTLNFVSGGRYLGTYYPFSGCLEDFNSGPVNGTWTITIQNDPSPFYGGAILDFRLIFCDDRGVDCCFADPGLLVPATQLEVCLGADTLTNLDFAPFYPGRMPDSTVFGYTYVIARDEIIISYDTLVNLSSAPPGQYQVCGLSYDLATVDDIPPVDAQITMDSLRSNLDSFDPLFCGTLTPTCASILISNPPDSTFLQETRCFGDSVLVGQTAFYTSGIYTQSLDGIGGCDSIVQLQLQILPEAASSLDRTICLGDTVWLGDESYFETGVYSQILMASTGCDSTITLHLSVLQPVTVEVDTAICAGDTLFVGAIPFWSSGSYTVSLQSVWGCDSIVQLLLDIIDIEAGIATPDTLTCAQPFITLNGQVIQGGTALDNAWTGPGIISSADSLSVEVNVPGTYLLEIAHPVYGCADTASTVVMIDTIAPVSDAGPDQVITCLDTVVLLLGNSTTLGVEMRYSWQTNNGQFVGPADQPGAQVNDGGVYLLLVENTINGCVDTSDVLVLVNQTPPLVNAGEPFVLNCAFREAQLDGSLSASGPSLEYQWSGPCLLGDANQPLAMADCPGVYSLEIYNAENGCSASDSVSVFLAQSTALAITPDTLWISCESGTTQIDASSSVFGVFQWEYNGAPAPFTEINPEVTLPGTYVLRVNTLSLDCPDSDTTVVILDCFIEAAIAPVDTLTCAFPAAMLVGSATTSGGGNLFQWFGPPGCIVGNPADAVVQAVCPGTYQLVVTSLTTGVSDTAEITLVSDQILPTAEAGLADTITCAQPFGILDGSNSSTGSRYRYEWTDANGQVVGQSVIDTVFQQGGYFLEVTDTVNGCIAVDFVTISRQTDPPVVNFGNTIFPCDRDSFLLRAFPEPAGISYLFAWTGPGLLSPVDVSEVWIDTTGLYVLELTNAITGCSTVANILITRPNCGPCLAVAPPDSITCQQLSVQLQASFCAPCPGCTFSWSAISGEILNGAGTLTPEVSAGSYRLSATDTFGITNTLVVLVPANNTPPDADAGPDRVLTCRDTTVLLGGPGSASGPEISYTWFSASGFTPENPDSNFTLANQPGIYWLQVADARTGCTAQDTVLVVTDTISPVANAGPDRQITCVSSFAIPDGSNSSLGDNFAYQWTTSGSGFIAAGDTTLNPIVNTTGIYRLQVTNRLNGCTSSDSMQVSPATQLPTVPDIPNQVLTCRDTVIQLNAGIEDTTGFSYQWCEMLNGNIPVSCTFGQQRDIQAPGIYRFEVTNLSTGCRNADFVTVTAHLTPPTVDAGLPPGILNCTQPLLQLNGSVESEGVPVDIAWFGLNGNVPAPVQSLQPFVNAPDTYVLRAIRADNGCVGEDSVVIVLNDNFPEASAGPDTSLNCLITQIRLQAAAQTIGAPVEWEWITSDGNIVDGAQTPTPLVNQAGSYILIITDPASGCIARDTILVGLNRNPPEIRVDAPNGLTLNCAFNMLDLDASNSTPQSDGPLQFQWTGEPGTVQGDPTSAGVRVIGVGFYRIIVTDAGNGCADTSLVQIGGNFEVPQVTVAPPLSLTCARLSVALAGQSMPTGSFMQYDWITPSGDTLMESTVEQMATVSGTYQLRATDTRNGCSALASVTVGLDTLPPVARIANPEPLDCGRPSTTLNGTASTGRGALGFQWSGPPGGIISGAGAAVAVAGVPGIYILTVTEGINGCRDTVQAEVQQVTAPITGVEVTAESPDCFPTADGSIIIDTILGGTPPFEIAFQGGAFGTQRRFYNLSPGAYVISIRDAASCVLDTQAVILSPAQLTVDLGPDTLIRLGDSLRLFALVNLPVGRYRWWVDGQLRPDTADFLPLLPSGNASIRVWVETADGCTASDWMDIFVERERLFFVPNAFSPNGDGHNDRFTLFSADGVSMVKSLRIFDRWGQLVFWRRDFLPNDPELGWDGTLDGRMLNPAVFVVMAEVELSNGEIAVYQGDLTLMR